MLTLPLGRAALPPRRGAVPAAVLVAAATAAAVPLLAAPPAAAQSVARWDAARFDQPGQRSLFLRTPNGGFFGLPLGGGDVDGDGREDALLCAFAAAEAFLFFAPPVIAGVREAVPAPGEVSRISGTPTLGVECAAGDLNGDGLSDLVLGAPGGAAPGRPAAGAVYVVFGSPALPPELDVESSGGVLKILGADAGDHFGVWVDAVDVDGDGFEDLLVGAPDADGPANDRRDAGEALIVFGGSDLVPGTVELGALASAGRVFTAFGADPGDRAGSAVDAGQVDGEGAAELVVGSGLNRAAQTVYGGESGAGDGPDETRRDAGEVAVVFNPERGGVVDLATPPADVAFVYGADPFDYAGEEVDVGDADGDGRGDLLVGALTADGPDNLRPTAGEAYLVYGGEDLRGRRVDLARPPAGVTTIYGPTAGGITGDTARFIDVDGDGRGDVFVGSPTGTFLGPDGRVRTGALFFVRSPAGPLPAVIDLDHPPVESLPFGVVLAADPGDILAYSLIRLDADGDGVDDVLVNGMTGSGLENRFPQAGEAYVLQGPALAAALEPFAAGDVNGDGAVDLRDLQQTIAVLLGRAAPASIDLGEADTNGNGELDPGDLMGIVNRVLQRNVLAPAPSGGSGLAKGGGSGRGESPRYGYSRGTGSAVFALVGAPASTGAGARATSRGRDQAAHGAVPLGAVSAAFSLAPSGLPPGWGPPAPRVVALADVQVFAAVVEEELRVLVLGEGPLPSGPLFAIAGAAPGLEGVTAATLGGSLRALEPAEIVRQPRPGASAGTRAPRPAKSLRLRELEP